MSHESSCSVCSVCSRLTGFGDEDKGEPPVNLARCPSPGGLECRAVAQAVAPLRRENDVLRSNCDHISSENASLSCQVVSMAMRIESLAEELAKPEDVRLREVLDALDEILAAARAEAVAPLEARVAELESERGALVEADILLRARVGEVMDVLRQLLEAMPPCTAVVDVHTGARCGKPATRAYGRGGARYCDDHGCHTGGLIGQVHEPPDYPRAAPLRLAIKLLAADQSDAGKAGKP